MRNGETGDIGNVIEEFFKKKEGRRVRFVIDGKTIRDGVFGGVEIETFHAKVFIDDSRIKERYYELPYPFHVETNESKGEIFLDYRTNSIATIQEN